MYEGTTTALWPSTSDQSVSRTTRLYAADCNPDVFGRYVSRTNTDDHPESVQRLRSSSFLKRLE